MPDDDTEARAFAAALFHLPPREELQATPTSDLHRLFTADDDRATPALSKETPA